MANKVKAVYCVVIVGLALACARTSTPPNVVIIAVDSLRPDHLGCYGHTKPTSPNIDQLARDGVLFENVISQASWTTPSFGTILTGLYPSQHGALTINDMIGATVPTLATILKSKGYATAAIVNAPALSPGFGFQRGFDTYDIAEVETRKAAAISEAGLKWVDSVGRKPFLLFLHYFDAHLPYSPPPPYDTLFDAGYKGWLGRVFEPESIAPSRAALLAAMKEWSPEDWDFVKALYDGEIRSTDDGIGILLRGLEDRGLKQSTLLVFVSDHGQEFFEHGAYGHGHSLHAEVLRVPLIFEFPGKLPQARRVQQQVRLLDVTPTILTLLGVKAETKFEGADLVPLATGRGPAEASPGAALPATIAYSEGVRLGGEMKAITTPAWKVIHHVESGSTEVFDLRSDPGEAVSLRGDGNASRDAVRTLFGAMFSMTDSWHVEIRAGSHPHRLDIAISASRGPVTGEIGPVRVIDGAGMYRPLESVAGGAGAHAAIAIKELLVADSLDLVFKSSPHRYPVNFDFKFDGRPATEITFLGSELERPEGMPFVQTPGKATSKSRGEPSRRPVPPYVLVWLSGGKYGEEGAALSESTKRQLRALGYLE
ncbi:MAG TPA: sulfatase [bacterium]|nr:sulfatase [bacterium]